ncbi:response regulator [Rubellimicrobium roseum]|uniref:histidine kinase n=2 Tax=Rubellimicrobium roseum TaxID=687525 RepID=A0A5C4NQS1_9RHOB|nr:response regulator [Rubellimicrobium roseum]
MGSRIQAFDWAATPLGAPRDWPVSLRAALSICLHSSFPTAIYWGPDLRLLYNDAWAPIPAERHPGALGRPAAEVWEDIWNVVGPQFAKVLRTGEGFSTFDQLLPLERNGQVSETYWNYSFTPIRGEDGRIMGVFNQGHEVTDRVLGERRNRFLLNLSDRLRALSDAGSIIDTAQDALGRHLRANRVGYGDVEETARYFTTGSNWTDGTVPSRVGIHDLEGFGPEVLAALRAGVPLLIQDAASDPRTSSPESLAAFDAIDTRAVITASLVKEGRMKAALYVHAREPRSWTQRDAELVTEVAERTWSAVERVKAEAETRASEERLRELNETLEAQVAARTEERDRIWQVSRDMLGVADENGVWSSINPAWSHTLGWEANQILGRTSEWLEHPDDRARTRAEIAQLAQGRTTLAFENRFQDRDGRYHDLSWTAVPADGMLYCVARDVTEEKRRAADLEAAQGQLRQAQKMEAVGQLTGGLAHDFNNLLTGVIGSLDLLGQRLAQGRLGDAKRYVSAAQDAAQRAAALTHRLLAFSRRQTLDPKPTNINRLVGGVENLVRRTVGPAIAVDVAGATDLWLTLVDPPQLENALLNLCINARDAMPDGGRLTIETANHLFGEREASEYDLVCGPYVGLRVTDTGTGMPAEVIANAFDPFFTTKPLGHGTGLGLSMVYGFVRQSGGQVRIASRLGQGTTVDLYLPRHEGQADEADHSSLASRPPRARKGQTVLVVDDEPTVRMLIADVLDELGYGIIEAADGASGLAVLRSDAQVDLVVTDVGLPGGMNGRQMADAARARRPHLLVLFITGYAEAAVIRGDQLEPGMQVMTKPFNLDDLATRVCNLLDSGPGSPRQHGHEAGDERPEQASVSDKD